MIWGRGSVEFQGAYNTPHDMSIHIIITITQVYLHTHIILSHICLSSLSRHDHNVNNLAKTNIETDIAAAVKTSSKKKKEE